MAVASARPYASLHLAPDRQPCQHPTTRFLQAGCPSCRLTNSVKALKACAPELKHKSTHKPHLKLPTRFLHCLHSTSICFTISWDMSPKKGLSPRGIRIPSPPNNMWANSSPQLKRHLNWMISHFCRAHAWNQQTHR